MTPLKFVWDRVSDNSPLYTRLVVDTPHAVDVRREQTIHWLQQKLGLTEKAARALMAD